MSKPVIATGLLSRVNEMTRVLDGEAKKQKGACNYDLFEMKLDFSSKLESFVKDVSKFGVVSVTKKHCSTSLVKEVKLQAQIPMFVPNCSSYNVSSCV
jgi:hypothetical protein